MHCTCDANNLRLYVDVKLNLQKRVLKSMMKLKVNMENKYKVKHYYENCVDDFYTKSALSEKLVLNRMFNVFFLSFM